MNRWITISIFTIVALVLAMVIYDYLSTRTDNRPANPFAYNIEHLKPVEDSLKTYTETRRIRISGVEPADIAWNNGHIYLLSDASLQIINFDGKEIMKTRIEPGAVSIAVDISGTSFVGYENYIVSYDSEGEEIARSAVESDDAFFTALAATRQSIFVADGASKIIRVFNHELEQTGAFRGESGVSDVHGFILPSSQFDLGINSENELWVTNPGIHSIQNYTENGRLRGYWGKTSFGPEGFSGCCNPSYIAFLSDDSFVTSEKGLIRVKVYNPSGELKAVVAAPDQFKNGTRAPALAVDDEDNILVLDYDKKLIRFFAMT